MKYLFTENGDIAKKNSNSVPCGSNEINLTNFMPKAAIVAPIVRSVVLHALCRKCGYRLPNKVQQIMGICPTCDNA